MVFRDGKDIVCKAGTTTISTLLQFIESEKATGVHNHTPDDFAAGSCPKKFEAKEPVAGFKIATEPMQSLLTAAKPLDEIRSVWTVKKNGQHKVVPCGVALVTTKQITIAAGEMHILFA